MESRVPFLSSLWSGTGTVMVDPSIFFCIITWLPRLRISSKPLADNIEQTSFPDKTRNLTNGNLHLGDVDFTFKPGLYF